MHFIKLKFSLKKKKTRFLNSWPLAVLYLHSFLGRCEFIALVSFLWHFLLFLTLAEMNRKRTQKHYLHYTFKELTSIEHAFLFLFLFVQLSWLNYTEFSIWTLTYCMDLHNCTKCTDVSEVHHAVNWHRGSCSIWTQTKDSNVLSGRYTGYTPGIKALCRVEKERNKKSLPKWNESLQLLLLLFQALMSTSGFTLISMYDAFLLQFFALVHLRYFNSV